jgi:hypothetical protein
MQYEILAGIILPWFLAKGQKIDNKKRSQIRARFDMKRKALAVRHADLVY